MAQLIVSAAAGDTPKVIEDKTRALVANQGLNNTNMWHKIDTEIAAAEGAGKIIENEEYIPAEKYGE
jgi:hypothetical protein